MNYVSKTLENIRKRKLESNEFIPTILVEKTIQTLQEYIADNLEAETRHMKIKANARIEAYTDCINLLRELIKENKNVK